MNAYSIQNNFLLAFLFLVLHIVNEFNQGIALILSEDLISVTEIIINLLAWYSVNYFKVCKADALCKTTNTIYLGFCQ